MVTEKIGGMPGSAMTIFLPCAEAGAAAPAINAAASAAPIASLISLPVI